jgi:hypothetical protein
VVVAEGRLLEVVLIEIDWWWRRSEGTGNMMEVALGIWLGELVMSAMMDLKGSMVAAAVANSGFCD